MSIRPWRRTRRATALLATAAALTLGATTLAAADSVAVDGDVLKAPPNVQYGPTSNPGNNACAARGTAVVGEIALAYDNAGSNPKHYTAGESLTIGISGTVAGISVTPEAGPSIPATWTTGSTHDLTLSTTVATSVPVGSYQITVTVTGQTSGVIRDDQFNVVIDAACPVTSANTAPSVAFTTSPTTSAEGSGVGYAFSINDPDAGQTWSYAAGYPDCDGGALSGAAIDNATRTGSFTCTFPDGPATHSVAVKVTDSAGASSNEAVVAAGVENVNPTVAAPAFTSTTVDCRNAVTLGGISFSDPGLLDADWSVSISWGDGSTDTTYDTATQGAQSTQSHTYDTPGTYVATVTVTDKDGGEDSATSSNAVTVAQTYAVDFLPPFDDSSPSGLIVNKMKNGRVVPVKATLYDECALSFVTDPTKVVTIKTSKTAGTGTGDPIEEYADAGQSSSDTNRFRWSSDGFWIYNLDSKALGLVVNNNYRVDIHVGAVKATVDSWAVLQPVK